MCERMCGRTNQQMIECLNDASAPSIFAHPSLFLNMRPVDFRAPHVYSTLQSKIFHGRNEDLEPRVARNLTLSLRFVGLSDGRVLHGTDWYWFTTGLRTAMMKGAVSISGNYRFGQASPLSWVLSEIESGVIPDMLLFRQALSSANNFFSEVVQQVRLWI